MISKEYNAMLISTPSFHTPYPQGKQLKPQAKLSFSRPVTASKDRVSFSPVQGRLNRALPSAPNHVRRGEQNPFARMLVIPGASNGNQASDDELSDEMKANLELVAKLFEASEFAFNFNESSGIADKVVNAARMRFLKDDAEFARETNRLVVDHQARVALLEKSLKPLLDETKDAPKARVERLMLFMKAYAESARWIGIKMDTPKLTELLEGAGYKKDDALNLPEKQYDDDTIFCRYVVGAFLDFTPHSIRAVEIFTGRYFDGTR
jgi:hypothetical protein